MNGKKIKFLILILFLIAVEIAYAVTVKIYGPRAVVEIEGIKGLWSNGNEVTIQTEGAIFVISGAIIPESGPKIPRLRIK